MYVSVCRFCECVRTRACVCELITCMLQAPVWLSVWRVLTFVWGRRRRRRGEEEHRRRAAGAWERQSFWKKFKRRQEALIKQRFLHACVAEAESDRESGRRNLATTMYPLLSRCSLTCHAPPSCIAFCFLFHLSPLPNKGKEVCFHWCQAEQRHRMKHFSAETLAFMCTLLQSTFDFYFHDNTITSYRSCCHI